MVCVGSLLGVALMRHGSSFPVGKVDFLTIHPVSFKEYLKAADPSFLQEQLAKENKKFKFALVEKNARARDYENAIEWLHLAGLVYKIYATETICLPLNAYREEIVPERCRDFEGSFPARSIHCDRWRSALQRI